MKEAFRLCAHVLYRAHLDEGGVFKRQLESVLDAFHDREVYYLGEVPAPPGFANLEELTVELDSSEWPDLPRWDPLLNDLFRLEKVSGGAVGFVAYAQVDFETPLLHFTPSFRDYYVAQYGDLLPEVAHG